MKKFNMLKPLGMIILLIFAIACKKDEQTSVGFMMKAVETHAPVNSSNQQPPEVSDNVDHLQLDWSTAWIYITRLQLIAEYYGISAIDGKNKYPDFTYEWQGIQKIDLLKEPRIFATMELPEGVFKHLELTMTSQVFGTRDDPNFFLSGHYGPMIGGVPISVLVTQEFEMNFVYNEGDEISTDEGEIFKSMVEVSLDQVFEGITPRELDQAELTDGWLIISQDHNTGLYEKILSNLTGKHWDSMTWQIHYAN